VRFITQFRHGGLSEWLLDRPTASHTIPITDITIVGNGAVFDAKGKDYFFRVGYNVAFVMSNVTLQNGYGVQQTG
jgi:hypothetical protein